MTFDAFFDHSGRGAPATLRDYVVLRNRTETHLTTLPHHTTTLRAAPGDVLGRILPERLRRLESLLER